jgi:hypothetical protein
MLDTTSKTKVRGALGALLLAAGLLFLVSAAMRLAKVMSAKGAAERQDAIVVAVLSFKDDATEGQKSLIPRRVTRATFDVEGPEGERIAGHADARVLFPGSGPAAGERVSVYRYGSSREFFLDRWPWNYGAVAEHAAPGIILAAIGAALLVPVLRRRKSAATPTL